MNPYPNRPVQFTKPSLRRPRVVQVPKREPKQTKVWTGGVVNGRGLPLGASQGAPLEAPSRRGTVERGDGARVNVEAMLKELVL